MELLNSILEHSTSEAIRSLNIPTTCLRKTLIEAIATNNVELTKHIIEKTGIDLNYGIEHHGHPNVAADNFNPLLTALANSNVKLINYLISKGANVKIVTPRGTTTVHYALQRELYAIAIYLVRLGAKLDTDKGKAQEYIKCIDSNEMLTLLTEMTNSPISESVYPKCANVANISTRTECKVDTTNKCTAPLTDMMEAGQRDRSLEIIQNPQSYHSITSTKPKDSVTNSPSKGEVPVTECPKPTQDSAQYIQALINFLDQQSKPSQ
jgi:hypothetical protein